jgi:hypothetical protein
VVTQQPFAIQEIRRRKKKKKNDGPLGAYRKLSVFSLYFQALYPQNIGLEGRGTFSYATIEPRISM